MNRTTIRRATALFLCVVLMAVPMVGCGSKDPNLGEPIMTLEGQSVTENMVKLLMARVKGNLQISGYSVNSDSFWDQISEADGTRYDEYTRKLTLRTAEEYLAASVLFDEKGMTLPQSTTEDIEQQIQEIIDAAGSKTSLNQELSQFDANVDILRALYIMEAKYAALEEELYGAEGSLISDNAKQQYLEENAIAFKRLLIKSSHYVYETDEAGDVIYYKDSSDDKVNAIAYDTVRGHIRQDENGKAYTDTNGDTIYYNENGAIAYDTENGKPAFVMDENGVPTTESCTAAELEQNRALAKELCARISSGDVEAFEALLAEYENRENAFAADSDLCFVYKTDNLTEELSEIADALQEWESALNVKEEIKPGDVVMKETDQGIYIMMRYGVPSDAATNSEYTLWFSELAERISGELYEEELEPYLAQIQLDEERVAALPNMKQVVANTKY